MRAGVMGVVVAGAVAAGLAGCNEEIVCPAGQRDCGGACVDVALDAANCGACGKTCNAGEACRAGSCTDCASACGAGQTCEGGVCKAALYVACFSTDDVVGVNAELAATGPARDVDDGPVSLAWAGDRLWAAHGFTVPTLVGFTPNVAGQQRHTLGGDYLNAVTASEGTLYTTDHAGTLVVVRPEQGVVDEVALGAAGVEVNPRGVGVVTANHRAVVALYGDAITPTWDEGQSIAIVDVSGSPTCAKAPCGAIVRRVALNVPSAAGVVGAYDAPGLPFPADVAVHGRKAYVTLANLKEAGGFYGTPAGHGRLAVVDTSSLAAEPAFVDLGASCTNPGSIVADGSTLWVSCGGSMTVVPVEVGGAAPVVGAPIDFPIVPGAVAVCGGVLYVADQYSGQVARVAASGGTPAAATVCTGGQFFDWASALACGAAP